MTNKKKVEEACVKKNIFFSSLCMYISPQLARTTCFSRSSNGANVAQNNKGWRSGCTYTAVHIQHQSHFQWWLTRRLGSSRLLNSVGANFCMSRGSRDPRCSARMCYVNYVSLSSLQSLARASIEDPFVCCYVLENSFKYMRASERASCTPPLLPPPSRE